jgi:hypothetical protein
VVRVKTIATHAVTLRAIGAAGRALIEQRPDSWASTMSDVFSRIDWARTNAEWDGVVIAEGDVLNRRQNQRDLTELLRVKLEIALPEERLRRLVHEIGHRRPQLALTARLRAADTREAAVDDVAKLESGGDLRTGATAELRQLLDSVYLEAA